MSSGSGPFSKLPGEQNGPVNGRGSVNPSPDQTTWSTPLNNALDNVPGRTTQTGNRSSSCPKAPTIGRTDLDPFSGPLATGGGGMLFDVPKPQSGPWIDPNCYPTGLPSCSVPPGARFDPVGPADLDRVGNLTGVYRFCPDPDHLPMPGSDKFL